MQGRGLKLNDNRAPEAKVQVAPHAGAWIETLECVRPDI